MEPADNAPVVPRGIRPAELLAAYPRLRPPVSAARAAVTIVLRGGADDVEILLIERANNPDDPASGHVALPGGRVDDGDGSLADTAVRELEEEVGIPPADVLDSLRFVRAAEARRFGMTVGVFAAELPDSSRGPSPRSQIEVAHVFWLPSRLLHTGTLVPRTSLTGDETVRATVYDGHILWGFTRRVLRDFFGLPVEDPPSGVLFAQPPAAPQHDRSEPPHLV